MVISTRWNLDGVTKIAVPENNKINSVMFKKRSFGINKFGDIYIEFKNFDSLKEWNRDCRVKLLSSPSKEGVCVSFCRDPSLMRFTFYKREKDPHEALDEMICVIANHFNVALPAAVEKKED